MAQYAKQKKGVSMEDWKKVAVLIDADNTQSSKIGDALQEISTLGRIAVKRAYGNWRKEYLKGWEPEIKRFAIKAAQQFDCAVGKNATDMALTIDAMDLLHSHEYHAFAIVASDSDYTPLAIRLREAGVKVIGVGSRQATESFRNACDEFLFLDDLPQKPSGALSDPPVEDLFSPFEMEDPFSDFEIDLQMDSPTPQTDDLSETDVPEKVHVLLREASVTWQDSDGFVNLAAAGNHLHKQLPLFDCRAHGYAKLLQLLEAFPYLYEIKRYLGKNGVTIASYRCLT